MKSNRNLINTVEVGGSVSYLQFIGFVLIVIGVLALVCTSLYAKPADAPNCIAVFFLVTMLGLSFAFPSLLAGNDGISTMRVVVFMITNVICMLLLKIGWGTGINSLKDIGMDQYWMGVIAFVFGAKATQSFFESRMAGTESEIGKAGMASVPFGQADIARLAVIQNEQFLKARFPNIKSISDAVHDTSEDASHVVALYLKDDDVLEIPPVLEVKMPDGKTKTIATEIVKNAGSGNLHISQRSKVSNAPERGSVCCMVDYGGTTMAVTSGHVFSKGKSDNYHGDLDLEFQTPVKIDDKEGTWFFQQINPKNDVALIKLDILPADSHRISFGKHYVVGDDDVKKTQVRVVSNTYNPQVRDAYIIDYNTRWPVPYNDGVMTKNNIIMIGTTNNRQTSMTVSERGDSGGCVYEPKTNKLVGIILGGNNMCTWVLPLKEIFDIYGCVLK